MKIILIITALIALSYGLGYVNQQDELEIAGIDNYSEVVGLAQFRENEE